MVSKQPVGKSPYVQMKDDFAMCSQTSCYSQSLITNKSNIARSDEIRFKTVLIWFLNAACTEIEPKITKNIPE